MIVTRLHGRLGNQMFQYAAARALALRLGVEVALDPREALARGEGVLTEVFDLPVAPPQGLPPARSRRLAYALWRYGGGRPTLRRERGLGYNPGHGDWGDGSYLHGYWQSARYFAPVSEQIRADFTFPPIDDAQNAEMAERIADGPSVSLHVRRGDYLSLAAHVLCDRDYYVAALEAVTAGMDPAPTVYVFSDDPDWARENLPLPLDRVIVDFNGADRAFRDMQLMSLCDHHVIANSSFSWWGAWLNPSPTRRVAAPARWFGDPKLANPDILPDGWLRIGAA